MSQEIAEGTE